MTEKDAMLKDVAHKAALAVVGVAALSPGPSRVLRARKQLAGGAVTNAGLHFMAGAAPE